MTYEEQRTAIVHGHQPRVVGRTTRVGDDPVTDRDVIEERRVVSARPSASAIVSRVVALAFGLVQLVIGLRFVLLAIDARQGNAIVATILDLSRPLVDPFEGILRTDALHANGAVLDLAALVALIGWTILELVVLGILRVGRPGASD